MSFHVKAWQLPRLIQHQCTQFEQVYLSLYLDKPYCQTLRLTGAIHDAGTAYVVSKQMTSCQGGDCGNENATKQKVQ